MTKIFVITCYHLLIVVNCYLLLLVKYELEKKKLKCKNVIFTFFFFLKRDGVVCGDSVFTDVMIRPFYVDIIKKYIRKILHLPKCYLCIILSRNLDISLTSSQTSSLAILVKLPLERTKN